MITNPLRHPFNMSVPSWPKPTPGLAARAVCFPRQPGSTGTVLGQESSSSKASSASCCELGRAVRAPARCQHFIPEGWSCGLGLYFQHSLPAPHTVPRVSNPPEPQQGHGASQTWVSYCHVTFPQAGGPHRSSSARGTGTAPEQSSHGAGRAGYPTSELQGHTTFPSPSKSAQPGNCSESDNTGGEPPPLQERNQTETAVVLHRAPLHSLQPRQVGCKHTAMGRELGIICVTLLRPGEVQVAPASTGVAVPHLLRLLSLVRLSLCHLCYHHTSPQDPKLWLHRDRQHFGDSRRGGGFFWGVSEPQVTVLESRELLAAPRVAKVFGLHGVGWGFGSKAHQAS